MNFKSVTLNLLLTTLSGGILMQTLEAQAASITWGAWNSDPLVLHTRFATGNANASPNILRAFAQAASTDDPLSRGFEIATADISLTSSFTVTPETGEKNGDQVRAVLEGTLEGYYGNSGQDESGGNFLTDVTAYVDADGFEPWSSISPMGTDEPRPDLDPVRFLVLPPGRHPISEPIFRKGYLTIGNTYQLDMSLDVSAAKTGIYQGTSNFGDQGGLRVNIRTEPTPEPLTMLASATALGFGAFFKREHSKKLKKC
jgi:hypothetical protein